MKKLTLKIIVVLTFFSQSLIFAENDYSCTNEYLNIINDNNILWNIFDNEKYVKYSFRYDGFNGNFKLPFEFEKKDHLTFTASGGKHLKKGQFISGNFSYHNQLLYNKKWIHNSVPYTGMPFFIADSSIGNFKLNGISWNLNIVNEIIENRLNYGVSFFYNVDEQIKTVFPKTIIKRSDFSVKLFSGIKTNNIISTIYGKYFNFKENIKTSRYSLEQGLTPIFIKIRNMDNPFIYYGETSEERLISLQGYTCGINFRLPKRLKLLAEYEYAIAQNEDGGANIKDQGSWFSNRFLYDAELKLKIKNIGINGFSNAMINEQTAKYPNWDVETYEYTRKNFTNGVGINYCFGKKMYIKHGIFYSIDRLKRIDKFTGILQYFPTSSLKATIDIDYAISSKLNSNIYFSLKSVTPNDNIIYDDLTGWYYNSITKEEEQYYLAYYDVYTIKMNTSFRLNNSIIYIIEGKYSYVSHNDDKKNSLDNRNYFSINLILKRR
ncbi:MAG: hypothetical protein U9Q27_03605 [Patescibacteria group bacterium]|nr:hypothetical protein [Patescibacteria group bacterium]MEA3501097.1 hypothetical protein [Candidatus Neomarinimicrobiota bacterium]